MSITVERYRPDGTVERVERPSVDTESFALAQHFLRDEALLSEDNLWELAGEIQQAVESWFDHKQSEK